MLIFNTLSDRAAGPSFCVIIVTIRIIRLIRIVVA